MLDLELSCRIGLNLLGPFPVRFEVNARSIEVAHRTERNVLPCQVVCHEPSEKD